MSWTISGPDRDVCAKCALKEMHTMDAMEPEARKKLMLRNGGIK